MQQLKHGTGGRTMRKLIDADDVISLLANHHFDDSKENTDLLIKTEKHSKEFSAFSSKINEEFNMFQLQQEYALGQLQKLILQHSEQNQEIDAQKQILVDYKQFCTEQNQEIVNQFRQLLENYFKSPLYEVLITHYFAFLYLKNLEK